MENEQKTRIERLRELLDAPPFSGSQATLGRTLGKKSGAIVYQWLNRIRPITEKTAREIERRCHKPRGWMDRLDEGRNDDMTLSANEQIMLELYRGMTPQQQRKLLSAMRAAFDANQATEKALGGKLRTVEDSRVEQAFKLPAEKDQHPE